MFLTVLWKGTCVGSQLCSTHNACLSLLFSIAISSYGVTGNDDLSCVLWEIDAAGNRVFGEDSSTCRDAGSTEGGAGSLEGQVPLCSLCSCSLENASQDAEGM